MSKGYITIAQNNDQVDYLEQAYALALSLKNSQSQVKDLSVMVDKDTLQRVTSKQRRIFDQVIEMPWQDDAAEADWKVNNKWKVYYATPYDETVLLDSDMIFTTDVSHWWPVLAQKDFWATTSVRTYRNDEIKDTIFRKAFIENDLPNIYNAFMYFKQSDISSEIFKLAQVIFQNWQRFYHLYLPKSRPKHVSGDVVFALAIKILGYEHLTTRENIDSLPTFVHMKSELQGVNTIGPDWTSSLSSVLVAPDNLVIGNFRQMSPFHYQDKEWLTERTIKTLEKGIGV